MVSLAYDNAEWIIRSKVDDYFDTRWLQSRQLGRGLKPLLQWHRANELPVYADILQDAAGAVSDQISADELASLSHDIEAARRRLAEKALPTAADFLLGVDIRQMNYYLQAVQKNIDQQVDLLAAPKAEQDKKNADPLIDQLENWLGDFDAAQIKKLREIIDAVPRNKAYWLSRRQQRAEALVALLKTKPDKTQLLGFLNARWVERDDSDENDRVIRRQTAAAWQAATIAIDQLITAEQRQHFIAELNGYRNDLLNISRTADNGMPQSDK